MHGILDTQHIKQITGLLLLTSIMVIPWATPAGATIFWDDELEAGNTGYGLIEGAMAYDTSVKVSGNASLRLDYPQMCLQLADIPCGGFMDRNFPQTTTKWTRFYFRMSPGFQVHGVSTKWLRSDTNKPNNMSTWWMMWWGSYNWGNTVQATSIGTYNLYSSKSLVPGQWHCIEMHETLNTPGVANGINESWIDGVQVMGVYNMTYLAAGESYKFINNRLFRQGGYGNIWLDRLAVGDQRIGCLGSVPNSDTTPPRIPTGLSLR